VPKHLCNAPTKLMNDLGYGQNYRYAHNEAEGISHGQTYFPKEMGEQVYYQPTNRGLEIKIAEKLKKIRGVS
jgi:putative ATPase